MLERFKGDTHIRTAAARDLALSMRGEREQAIAEAERARSAVRSGRVQLESLQVRSAVHSTSFACTTLMRARVSQAEVDRLQHVKEDFMRRQASHDFCCVKVRMSLRMGLRVASHR